MKTLDEYGIKRETLRAEIQKMVEDISWNRELHEHFFEMRPVNEDAKDGERWDFFRDHRKFCRLKDWTSDAFIDNLLECMDSGWNCYVGVNPRFPNEGETSPVRGGREAVKQMWFLHADMDGYTAEQARDFFWAKKLYPTLVIGTSSQSSHVWFRLQEPIPITNKEESEKAKHWNRRLNSFIGDKSDGKGADKCFDTARVLRIPLTLNFPNAVKRAAGREVEPVVLFHSSHGSYYKLADFDRILPEVPTPAPRQLEHVVSDIGEQERIQRAKRYYDVCVRNEGAENFFAGSSPRQEAGERNCHDMRILAWDFDLSVPAAIELIQSTAREHGYPVAICLDTDRWGDYLDLHCDSDRGHRLNPPSNNKQADIPESEKTANAINTGVGGGDVVQAANNNCKTEIAPATTTPTVPSIVVLPNKPSWDSVGNSEVYAAIRGTPLQVGVDIMQSALVPSVPLEIALPNFLVLVGATMVTRRDVPALASIIPNAPVIQHKGRRLLKLSINTSGGQAANVYGLVVAPSGIGKDVGNVMTDVAGERGLLLGDDASGEGIYDELMDMPNGILTVPEFEPYFDARNYQHRVINVLTKMFNRGFFRANLSKRNKGQERSSDFAFPSLLASIQPHIFESVVTRAVLEKGFLGRMLITVIESKPAIAPRPCTVELDYKPIHDVLDKYADLKGVVGVPANYMDALANEAYHVHSSSTRIINEYGPRLALMLACDTTIKQEYWERAEVLCRYFLRHQSIAFGMVGANGNGNRQDQQEFLQNRILSTVGKLLTKGGEFATPRNLLKFDRKLQYAPPSEYNQALKTLIVAGLLDEKKDAKKLWYLLPQ